MKEPSLHRGDPSVKYFDSAVLSLAGISGVCVAEEGNCGSVKAFDKKTPSLSAQIKQFSQPRVSSLFVGTFRPRRSLDAAFRSQKDRCQAEPNNQTTVRF